MMDEKQVEHTAEPWVYRRDKYSDWGEINRLEGERVVIVSCNNYLSHVDLDECRKKGFDPGAANGRRIVACINACAGMDDPVARIRELLEAEKQREHARKGEDREPEAPPDNKLCIKEPDFDEVRCVQCGGNGKKHDAEYLGEMWVCEDCNIGPHSEREKPFDPDAPPIWDVVAAIGAEIPEEEWEGSLPDPEREADDGEE